MAGASRWAWLGVWCVLGAVPISAHACSCALSGLGSAFALSDNVFTALITGGILSSEDSSRTPGLSFTFEVTEVFKGSIPFDRLTSHLGGGSCGMSLNVGYGYLFFLQDDGKFGSCHLIEVVSPQGEAEPGAIEHLESLRSFKAGNTSALDDPWTFGERYGVCWLYTSYLAVSNRHASLRITFRHAPPPLEVEDLSDEYYQPGFADVSIFVPFADDERPPALAVRLGSRAFTANARTGEEHTRDYALHGEDVVAFTRALAHANDVRIASSGASASTFAGVAPITRLGTGAADMLRCMGVTD
jgi:hypothetical protein